MKKLLLAAIICLVSHPGFSQSLAGLIARYCMSGNANDSTGLGHNGVMHGLTPAMGRDSVMGHALYFSGDSSYITVPYAPDLNLAVYTICATIQVTKFFTGNCQGNYIIQRTGNHQNGNFTLEFDDNAYNGCNDIDTTLFVYEADAGPNYAAQSSWQGNYHVMKNRWVSLVAVFDGSQFKIYQDGILTNTTPSSNPGTPIGASTDGLIIGKAFTTSPSNSTTYPFTGIIDDIRIYNRVLADSETVTYTNSTMPVHHPTGVAVVNDSKPSINVFPNPAQSAVRVHYNGAVYSNMSLCLYNALGQRVGSAENVSNDATINIAGLPPGVYSIKLSANGNTVSSRFLKN